MSSTHKISETGEISYIQQNNNKIILMYALKTALLKLHNLGVFEMYESANF